LLRNRLLDIAVLSVSLSLSGVGFARPAPDHNETSDAITDKARELYLEGLKAYAQKQWQKAHVSFLAAWNLKKHYQIGGNLGDCELKMGRYRDAAEHLAYAVREANKDKDSDDAERARVEHLFAEVRTKVGTIEVRVRPPGAEVLLDGIMVGTAPLAEPLFVDPGEHVVSARMEGRASAKRTVSAPAGSAHTLALTLLPLSAEPAPEAKPPIAPWIALGGVLAAGGIGAGLAMTVAANSKSADAAMLRERFGSSGCFSPAPGTGAACATLRNLVEAQGTFSNAAVGGFVAGGVFALGTLGLAAWAGITTRPASATTGRIHVEVMPRFGAGERGISVLGSW